jgi:hypothetical protein
VTADTLSLVGKPAFQAWPPTNLTKIIKYLFLLNDFCNSFASVMVKAALHVFLSLLIVQSSLVYSVIQGSYELNKAEIIAKFCVNKDKPAMKCDGKCYLAKQLQAEKERQEQQSTQQFQADFGQYVPTRMGIEIFSPEMDIVSKQGDTVYQWPLYTQIFYSVDTPPKV